MSEKSVYCTLFDKNYLDKGLVMMESLLNADQDAFIYVLCMDDTVLDCLTKYNSSHIHTISFSEFMDEELLKIKKERGNAEFCWTCTARLVRVVLEKFKEPICTYVDADLYFYSNPQVLVNEMKENNCTVQVIPHQFPDTKEGRLQGKLYGLNCVQFNTFTNEQNSLDLLKKWEAACITECSKETVGDQMFTSDWGKYSFVNVSKNRGAGVAPWNVYRYKHVKGKKDYVYDRYDHKEYKLIFYHFAQIYYKDRENVYIMPPKFHWSADSVLIKMLYLEYLKKADNMKTIAEKLCGFSPLIIKDKSIDGDKKRKVTVPVSKWTLPLIWGGINHRLLAAIRKSVCNLNINE